MVHTLDVYSKCAFWDLLGFIASSRAGENVLFSYILYV
ncbi:hypothetical protein APHCR_0850 [Anaplasma phagocytophilum str. CR1007]|nr:hypothetical protein APHWEB_0641 [Anaplasma phagocytophilum str. Webster]KJV82659.1 hypothetical protein APHHGE2_0106 [Anaplasma phagocytophilum str. HGE2]KJV86466.1 hypothetical protein APHNYW_1418 [Anaplasma phagocytophilum str. ApNYW]KJV99763.1 hypothetical protein OTSANNIE_0050 [Anaplasma phagocytophilum str. Annie]KJZ99159.1 hypothetical protein APHCR_0850 [Anaplasma phagocytophilum str. CR1007]KJZ99837.1 hypothetical protein APHDU1_0641 [Anaplasma phagocytophilum]